MTASEEGTDGTGRDSGSGEDHTIASIHEIVARLERLVSMEFIRLGSIRPEALSNWSDHVTTESIIPAGARTHYRTRHPEVMGYERFIVEAILDPDEVHIDPSHERTNSFFKAIDDRYDIMVSVWVSDDPGRFNAVKSARKQRNGDRRKGRALGHQVWGK